ncbi:LysR family transcriptional regulator [Listeria booriae]|uniref:LysR family transcriptional regulator n=1 Tax=Listeria booriae TaxID=1552123 RepID=UPI001623F420|nr:LysR family transcriptional regulator [Listeria booriae]MBC2181588.1 LysR family transcriptional regulator [Listeria booriae]
MKLSSLNYFVEVATEGSFTKASEKLYISQPTLSRRIQELENELGVALFIRHSHKIELSEAGEKFLVEVNDVLKRLDNLAHMFDTQTSPHERPQVLKIGYLANFNMGKMYELLDRFKMNYPNLQFLMKQDTPMNLSDGLCSGEYDLVFDLSVYFQASENIEQVIFKKNHLQIAVPTNNSLAHKNKVDFADLSQETFILLERQQSPVIVDYVINQGIRNGFHLKANHYVKDLDEGLSMVSLGNGLAFLYSGMNDGSLEEKYRVKIIDLKSDTKGQNIVMAIDKNNTNNFLQELFHFVKKDLLKSDNKI